MEKLELKHLAPYLPYGLNIQIELDDGDIYSERIIGLDEELAIIESGDCMIGNFKPIFHPLSRLTEEIEHDGEKFVPIQHEELVGSDIVRDFSKGLIHYDLIKYGVIQKLFEWHFNVFDLPEELYIKKS